MKKKLLAIALIFTMIFTMVACGDSGNESADNAAKTNLTIIDSEWYGLDTFQLDGSSGGQSFVSATLFEWDPEESKVVDNVCTDWTVSDDGSYVTFNVPEGMKFSTGEPVEPEDVKASIEHGLEVSPYRDGYQNIESIEIDGRQVKLNLSHFSSDMEYYFTADFICIIDKDELDSMSNEELMWGCHPYGPYRLADENGYVSGSEVNLVRNDDYICFNPLVKNQGAWNFETIKLRFNVEDFTATEEILNGDVDYIMSLGKEQMQEIKESEDITIVNAAYPCINYIELNTDDEVLSDINVRKALALSINRDNLVEVTGGTVVPAYSIIYDTMQCFSKEAYDWFKENLSNDPEKAKQILEEAGWVDTDGDGIREKDGQKLQFTLYGWDSWSTAEQALAEQLKATGFQMDLELIDWNYIYEYMADDDYDAGMASLGWAEPILILNMCYYDKNSPGYNDQYLELVKTCSSEPDTEKRVDKITEVQMHMFENVDMIPLVGDNGFEAFRSGLTGYVVQKDGTMLLNDLSY